MLTEWHALTPFGEAIRIWPVALLAGGLLAWRGHARAAVVWLSALLFACLLVMASKIAFYGWGVGVRAWNLTCFSGHVVQALGLWPVLLAMAVPVRWPTWRTFAFSLGVLLAGLVGISRFASRAHPPSEVIAGALLGIGVALVGLRALHGANLPPRRSLIVFALAALLFLVDGDRFLPKLPSERWFQQIAVALSGHEKPVSRRAWLRQI